jgi:TonB family protein
MLTLLLLLCLLHSGNAQAGIKPANREQHYRLAPIELPPDSIKPTPDPKSKTGFNIPKNVEDSLKELDRMLPVEAKEAMRRIPEDAMAGQYHFLVGMWIRNNWGLWDKSRLAKYFAKLGVEHPDDMSGIVLQCYWRHLNKKPIESELLIAKYKKADHVQINDNSSATWQSSGSETANGPYQIGYGVSPPKPLKRKMPSYTEEARHAGVQGDVITQCIIRSNGKADNCKTVQGLGYGLDEASVKIIMEKWQFQPGFLNGKPVDTIANISVSFRLY